MSWRNALGTMLSAALLAASVAAGPLVATKVKADIPFAFQVDGKSYAAGTYYFESTQWQGVLAFSDEAGHKRLLGSKPIGSSSDLVNSRLNFARTKTAMVLSEVWMNANTGGHKLNAPAVSGSETVQVAMAR